LDFRPSQRDKRARRAKKDPRFRRFPLALPAPRDHRAINGFSFLCHRSRRLERRYDRGDGAASSYHNGERPVIPTPEERANRQRADEQPSGAARHITASSEQGALPSDCRGASSRSGSRAMLSAAPVFQRLGANSSDRLESPHPRRIDASIARAANRITVRGRAASTAIAHRSYSRAVDKTVRVSGMLYAVIRSRRPRRSPFRKWSIRFSTLIGADGIHSVVRHSLFGPG
jgi:hypothetical protein